MSSWRTRKVHGPGGEELPWPTWSADLGVAATQSVPGSILTGAIRAGGLDYPRAIVVTNSPEVRINLLATGRFLTIFSTSSLRFYTGRPRLKSLPIELPMSRVPIGIVTLKGRTLSPVARLFIEHAREVAKLSARRRR